MLCCCQCQERIHIGELYRLIQFNDRREDESDKCQGGSVRTSNNPIHGSEGVKKSIMTRHSMSSSNNFYAAHPD